MPTTAYERRLLAAADLVLASDHHSPLPRRSSADLGVTVQLKPHQLDGVHWLIRRYHLGVNVLLGDEMGLGKTLQAISLLSYLKIQSITPGPFLVLCPLSVTHGWSSEFARFCPTLKVIQYAGDKAHRRDLRRIMHEGVQKSSASSNSNELPFDVMLTSYDIALMDQDFLSQIPWLYVVIDEAQRLKNPSSFSALWMNFFLLSRKQGICWQVIQLRKACSHPYLFSGIEPEPYEEGEHLVQASGKLIVLDLILKKLHRLGHRVLLFAQMTHTLDILQDFLELRNYTYERLDGSVRAEERFAAIRKFSSQPTKGVARDDDNPSGAFVFMISTRAGGVGLNLIGADTVIFYEQDWNPQADKQALQRAHRIGQLNHVLSINLVSQRTIEEVIMRRAERKLKLSHNIFGDEDTTDGKGEDLRNEASDMRSIIFGLHQFDPADTATETMNEETLAKLESMSENVIKMRAHEPSEKDDRAFEINPNLTDSSAAVITRTCDSINIDPGINEAAYLSWVGKFKEASHSIENVTVEQERQRSAPEEKVLKREANKKKAEEKRLAKWKTSGYETLTVKDPDDIPNQNISDSGSVQLVYGDCTNPSKVCPGKPAIIFSCVDNSGTWGHGGMFDALASLSTCIPDAYHRACEFDDLHLGDLHLIQLDGWLLHWLHYFTSFKTSTCLTCVSYFCHTQVVPECPKLSSNCSRFAQSTALLTLMIHNCLAPSSAANC
uniref:SNF2P n=1 Tax=Brachypodium distachyon TaxID=15368 RepID=C3SAD3_BRADI|nr:SNF2P [Brachypodium distachyon]